MVQVTPLRTLASS